jgi:hypothetical protein
MRAAAKEQDPPVAERRTERDEGPVLPSALGLAARYNATEIQSSQRNLNLA